MTLFSKPKAVWLLTASNAVLAVYVFVLAQPGLLHPPPERWPSSAVAFAPYLTVLSALLVVSSIWAWSGSKHGRNLLLTMLTAWIGVSALDDGLRMDLLITTQVFGPSPWKDGWFWLELLYSSRWLVWLGLNYWYFLGARGRAFFDSQS